jgi:hypothetical protein
MLDPIFVMFRYEPTPFRKRAFRAFFHRFKSRFLAYVEATLKPVKKCIKNRILNKGRLIKHEIIFLYWLLISIMTKLKKQASKKARQKKTSIRCFFVNDESSLTDIPSLNLFPSIATSL